MRIGLKWRMDALKEKTKEGDEFRLKEGSDEAPRYTLARICRKYPNVVLMKHINSRGKERTICWDWAKLAMNGEPIGKN